MLVHCLSPICVRRVDLGRVIEGSREAERFLLIPGLGGKVSIRDSQVSMESSEVDEVDEIDKVNEE